MYELLKFRIKCDGEEIDIMCKKNISIISGFTESMIDKLFADNKSKYSILYNEYIYIENQKYNYSAIELINNAYDCRAPQKEPVMVKIKNETNFYNIGNIMNIKYNRLKEVIREYNGVVDNMHIYFSRLVDLLKFNEYAYNRICLNIKDNNTDKRIVIQYRNRLFKLGILNNYDFYTYSIKEYSKILNIEESLIEKKIELSEYNRNNIVFKKEKDILKLYSFLAGILWLKKL